MIFVGLGKRAGVCIKLETTKYVTTYVCSFSPVVPRSPGARAEERMS